MKPQGILIVTSDNLLHVKKKGDAVIKFAQLFKRRQNTLYNCKKSLAEHPALGNCDIDFFYFPHWKVWNFEISNLFKRSQNFAVIFWKY